MKIIESRVYTQLIHITDYILLGLVWIISSLPILTIIPATTAAFYVVKQWKNGDDGRVIYYFYQGMKRYFFSNSLISVLTFVFYYTVDGMMRENSALILITGYFISTIYLMFVICWCMSCVTSKNTSIRKRFIESASNIIIYFIRNLLSVFVLLNLGILSLIFPPILFIFSGSAFWLITTILEKGGTKTFE